MPAGRELWAAGINEDGTEARVTTKDAASYIGSCYTDFVSLVPGQYGVKRSLVIPKNAFPRNGNCSGDGALAPRLGGSKRAP